MTLTEIRPSDTRAQAQVDALLAQEGITRDGNLDYTCGIFDDNWDLIATGSSFQNTLRCFAVDHGHQGEGLTNQVVSHLTERLANKGMLHLFLYTKCESAKFFSTLGFYEIARVEGALVFMENRRTGFSSYCAALEKDRREGRSAAIVMNANPFTLGHQRLVEKAAAENDTLHLFILSEEASLFPFAVRRELVHRGVAHLPNVICHDSGPYIISSATFPSYFLKDADTVIRTHAALDLAVFGQLAGRLNITRRYVGEEPTSHVTSLYNQVMAQSLPALGVQCEIVPRFEADGQFISASKVRQAIQDGDMEAIRPWVPQPTWDFLNSPQAAPVIQAIRSGGNVIHY